MIAAGARPKGAGRAGGSPLGNSTNNSSRKSRKPREKLTKDERKAARYRRRTAAQTVTQIDRFRDCGRAAYGDSVTLRLSDGRAGVAGVMCCGSVWVCSVCSAKIAARRHEELSRGINTWTARGGRIAMLTLTMRHRKGHRLKTLWDALSYAWAGVTSGRRWTTEKAMYGLAGFTRTVELTEGKHGWHVHIHALLFIDDADMIGGGLTDADLIAWKHDIVQRWGKRLEAKGLTQLDDVQDLRFMGTDAHDDAEVANDWVARYVTKSADMGDAVAAEISYGTFKRARGLQNRTPWDILDDVIKYGDADDVALWWEYEEASRGRRQLTWSKGLRKLLGLEDEKTDEEVADEEEGTKDDDVLRIPAGEWFHLSADGAVVAAVLLELELHGVDACEALIFDLGYRCTRVVH